MDRYIKRAPVIVNPVVKNPNEKRMRLEGEWNFKLDPRDIGIEENWFCNPEMLTERIQVPGCWQGYGFGNDDYDLVRDFEIPARVFRATYKGTGWYAKAYTVPQHWEGMRIWVNFGGVHPSAQVWLNGILIGENHAPFVPFGFDVSSIIRFDKENLLVVRVHEESRIFGLAYSWQGNWSGLYRDVEITATGPNYLEYVRLYPDVDSEVLGIKAKIGDLVPSEQKVKMEVTVYENGSDVALSNKSIDVIDACLDTNIPVKTPGLWSPDSPSLYRVDAVLLIDGQVVDAISHRTGFVKLTMKDKHFLINDQPYYMRGSGDFLSNPETGCPDTDRDRWRRKLKMLREYGYNYVRCQSYVYGPEYFDAADEVGMLVQSEMGMLGAWSGSSVWHEHKWPQPTLEHREILKWQWDRVVMRDVNNPSANMYCMSNEFGDGEKMYFPRIAWKCYHDTKAIKPTSLVIWTDGGHNDSLPEDFINAEASIDDRDKKVMQYRIYGHCSIVSANECTKPLIQHEFRWWSSLPDVRAMHKYSGAERPYGAEIAFKTAMSHGISHILPQGVINSQRLHLIEAKGKMEACRRDNSKLAGICHFNAVDYNLSPQGIIDAFYEKKYADAKTWLQTNGDTIIMCSLNFDDRILVQGEALECDLWVSDFSHPSLKSPELRWKLSVLDSILLQGEIQYSHQPYCTCLAGQIKTHIPRIDKAKLACLEVEVIEGERTYTNRWNIWLFPNTINLPGDVCIYDTPKYTWIKKLEDVKVVNEIDDDIKVVITEVLDGKLSKYIKEGGRAILAASEGLLRPFGPNLGVNVGRYFFTPPANYPKYEHCHAGTIIKEHCMLGDMPHEGFADLQFYRMISESPAVDLEPLGLNHKDPVIRAIHSYQVGRSLGYLIECSVGKGGLIITSLNLDQTLPEARYLLAQICNYASGDCFKPEMVLLEDDLSRIIKATMIP